jgi:hypothetical protein
MFDLHELVVAASDNIVATISLAIVVLGAVISGWRWVAYQHLLRSIAKLPEKDRLEALIQHHGGRVPRGISPEQWLTTKRLNFGLIMSAMILIAVCILVYISIGPRSTAQSSDPFEKVSFGMSQASTDKLFDLRTMEFTLPPLKREAFETSVTKSLVDYFKSTKARYFDFRQTGQPVVRIANSGNFDAASEFKKMTEILWHAFQGTTANYRYYRHDDKLIRLGFFQDHLFHMSVVSAYKSFPMHPMAEFLAGDYCIGCATFAQFECRPYYLTSHTGGLYYSERCGGHYNAATNREVELFYTLVAACFKWGDPGDVTMLGPSPTQDMIEFANKNGVDLIKGESVVPIKTWPPNYEATRRAFLEFRRKTSPNGYTLVDYQFAPSGTEWEELASANSSLDLEEHLRRYLGVAPDITFPQFERDELLAQIGGLKGRACDP